MADDEVRPLQIDEMRSYGVAPTKVGRRPWDNVAWMALIVPMFLDGAGTALFGLVLPEMTVMSYAGHDVCAAGKSDACDEAITATTALATSATILYGIIAASCSPLVGMLCDRFGRRPMILICMFLSQLWTLTSLGVYQLHWKFYWYYLSSLIPAFVPSQVVMGMWLVDMTTERNRASAYGLLVAVQIVYGFVAPLLVEFTGDAKEETLTAAALNMSVTCKLSALLLACLFLPESRPEAGGSRASGASSGASGDSPSSMMSSESPSWYQCFHRLAEDPTAKATLTLALLGSFMGLGESDLTVQYTKNQLSVTAPQRAGLRLCSVCAALFANTVLLRMLRGVVSVKTQMVYCCVMGIISHVLTMVAKTAEDLYPATLVGALGSLTAVYMSTLTANVAVNSALPLGAVMGVFSMATQFGSLVGPPIFSAMFLASLRKIFWGHPFPQLAFCFGIAVSFVIVRLVQTIPESAYEGGPPMPSEVAKDQDETSP